MQVKEAKAIIEACLDEYAKKTKTKKLTISEKDIKDRMKNPAPHDQTELFKKAITIEEKVRVKVLFALVDYLKVLM